MMLNRTRNTKQNKKKRKEKKNDCLTVYHNTSHSSIIILEVSPALFQTAPGTSSTTRLTNRSLDDHESRCSRPLWGDCFRASDLQSSTHTTESHISTVCHDVASRGKSGS